MDKQLGCGYFCCHSCGFKFEAWGSFHIGMHGRLELVITHIGRFSLSLSLLKGRTCSYGSCMEGLSL